MKYLLKRNNVFKENKTSNSYTKAVLKGYQNLLENFLKE